MTQDTNSTQIIKEKLELIKYFVNNSPEIAKRIGRNVVNLFDLEFSFEFEGDDFFKTNENLTPLHTIALNLVDALAKHHGGQDPEPNSDVGTQISEMFSMKKPSGGKYPTLMGLKTPFELEKIGGKIILDATQHLIAEMNNLLARPNCQAKDQPILLQLILDHEKETDEDIGMLDYLITDPNQRALLEKERELRKLQKNIMTAIKVDFDGFYEVAEHVGKQIVQAFDIDEAPDKGRYKTVIGSSEAAGIARITCNWFRINQFDLQNPNAGEHFAHYFMLKEDAENTKLFETPEGLKSYQELTAMDATVITEAMESLPKKYLVKSESERGFWSIDQGWVHKVDLASKFDAVEVDSPALLTGAPDAYLTPAAIAWDIGAPL